MYLMHWGILGQKWGVRRFQNPDGTLTAQGKERYQKKTVFVSGSSKTQDRHSKYYRKRLPKDIRQYILDLVEENADFVAGNAVPDACSADRRIRRTDCAGADAERRYH